MTIQAGTRMGPYEVVAPLGAGGMGEVYRAKDTRLDRHVAIKVLPAELSNNAQLRLRFEQEARTISALNHRKRNLGDLFWKISTGSGSDESLLEGKTWKIPNDWSEDGLLILFQNQDPGGKNGWDLWVYSIPERKASPVLQTEFNEFLARFSPDQKWIVYASNESASNQIYVQPFPGPGGKWQISTTGGHHPRWSHDGREIFYVAPDRKLMSVEVRTSPSFEAGIPQALFEVRPQAGPQPYYDVTADGKRFLVNTSVAPAVNHPITLVQNWTAELKR